MVNTTAWVLFVYIFLFCLGAISFAFLVSVFFSNSILAAIVTPVLFTGTLLPRYLFYGSNRYENAGSKAVVSLLLPSAFAFGADILGDFESNEIGISPDNWQQGDYSFLLCLQMMLLDAILYAVLALYLERVLPSKYGTREHPLFFLSAAWWGCAPVPISSLRARMEESDAIEPPPKHAESNNSIELGAKAKGGGCGGHFGSSGVEGSSIRERLNCTREGGCRS